MRDLGAAAVVMIVLAVIAVGTLAAVGRHHRRLKKKGRNGWTRGDTIAVLSLVITAAIGIPATVVDLSASPEVERDTNAPVPPAGLGQGGSHPSDHAPGPRGACYPVTGDWDGDRSHTLGVACRDGVDLRWWLANGIADASPSYPSFAFGNANDCLPITGDWDGNGRDSVGVACHEANRAEIIWRLTDRLDDGDPTRAPFRFGTAALCRPVAGKWDGGPRSGVGVACKEEIGMTWRLMTGTIEGAKQISGGYGNSTNCLPVVGNWDGDGGTTIGNACRKGNGSEIAWSLINGLGGSPSYPLFTLGSAANCRPVAGDWTGGGITGIGVACEEGGRIRWELMRSPKSTRPEYHSTYGTASGSAWSMPIPDGAHWPSWPR